MSWAIALVNDPKSRAKLFPGVRSKTLLELGALYFAFFYDNNREPSHGIIKRLWDKKLHVTNDSIAGELQPEDVIQVIGCSRSKAKQYISILRVMSM